MKSLLALIIAVVILIPAIHAQNKEENIKIYNPSADAMKDIVKSVMLANTQHKHVLIQVGGNWCSWCLRFHKFIAENPQLDSIVKADYVYVLLNYSKENKNLDILKKLDFPQRFGFPVLVVLDGSGKRLHTQDSGFLEKDESYDINKIKTFLLKWNKEALNPEKYVDKK